MRYAILVLLVLSACARPDAGPVPGLEGAEAAFLGESHDNPAHHRLQAEAVAAMQADALVFEMIPRRLETAPRTAEGLDWAARGWPDFGIYAPIFAAAPEAALYGAEVGREALRQAMREGAAQAAETMGLSPALGLDAPLPPDRVARLADEIVAAHCGAIPRDIAERMVEAQRLRDAALADGVLRAFADGASRVAVIAGRGHAQRDAAPALVERAAPERAVLAVGFTEGDIAPGFDAQRATEAVERGDPCAAFRSR